MAKEKNLKILNALFIIIFFYITNNQDIFLYVFSFSLIKIYDTLLEDFGISFLLKKYYDLKDHLTVLRLKNISIFLVTMLVIIFSLFNYLLGIILNIYLKINFLPETFLIASLTLINKPLLKITSNYLSLYGRKNNIKIIYKILSLFIFTLNAILFFRVFKINNLLSIYLLIISPLISLLIVYLSLTIFNKKKIKLKNNTLTKVNYLKIIKENYKKCFNVKLPKVLLASVNYLSILFLYYALFHLYHYREEDIHMVIDLTYFYGLNVILIIAYISYYMVNKKIELLKNDTTNINVLSYQINNLFNIILKTLFPITIICSVLYKAIWILIFNVKYDYSIIIFLIFMIFFLIIYNIFTQILGLFNNKKTFLISTLIIIIFKLIMTIPCINSFYMMGYNQVYGEIFSTTISYILGIIFIMITLNKKYQINFTDNFPNILNLLYNNIILTLILLLLSLVYQVNIENLLSSLISIIIYSVVGILVFIIKIYLDKLIFEKKRLS